MNRKVTQHLAAERVKHLPADQITCRYCGEQSISTGSFKGYAHRWGPTRHMFIARKPAK
jgi:hypothetical protein